jgi:hypothetical protein
MLPRCSRDLWDVLGDINNIRDNRDTILLHLDDVPSNIYNICIVAMRILEILCQVDETINPRSVATAKMQQKPLKRSQDVTPEDSIRSSMIYIVAWLVPRFASLRYHRTPGKQQEILNIVPMA